MSMLYSGLLIEPMSTTNLLNESTDMKLGELTRSEVLPSHDSIFSCTLVIGVANDDKFIVEALLD
jgi:hypothetical protein